ncbi:hypothetical protein RUM43_007974 [Polyplax serrata]|uniref:Ethylmalonyl-CoA decarboxylase n=1 Tax=Polyplax serrata TaxID=468196 RepID=A0AAN8P2L9_POLSC
MMASFYIGKEKQLAEIRKHLEKFSGGSVNLKKRGDGLAVIELNQPEKKNAMSGKMMVDLHDAVEELHNWTEGKGVILKGKDGNFCSGGDLDFVRQISTPEEGFMMSTFMQNTMNKFQRLPMISVALIEGIGGLGGGAELSVACDFRLMTETCKGIGFVHLKMGILPAWGGTNRLVEKIGPTKALEVLSTAKIFTPTECLKLGLADDIVPRSESPIDFALSWLGKRTQFDSKLIRSVKASVTSAKESPRDFETERRTFAPFWGGPINKEALLKNIKHKPEPS